MQNSTTQNSAARGTEKLAQKLSVAGDATRLKILCYLFEEREACVSTIAQATDVSVPTVSYHLNKMADKGFLTREKQGNSVCYRITETDFIAQLEKLVCRSYTFA